MPGGDGTGPRGQGAGTGWGRGGCVPKGQICRGMGFGRRNMINRDIDVEYKKNDGAAKQESK